MAKIIVFLLAFMTGITTSRWQPIEPGLDYMLIRYPAEGDRGEAEITVVRADPLLWELVLANAGKTFEERPRSTQQWCEHLSLTAAINAGMFNDDGITHTGYARYRDKVMSTHTNSYQSVAAFDPKSRKDLPPFRIIDLDEPGVTLKSVTSDYASVVQNLRLIKRPGVSMWSHRPNKWCEAALGEDSNGRILFIFSRLPLSMHELNNILLGSGTGILAAQHLEGGPLAQMYLRAGSTELNLSGNPGSQWGIPNVLGLKKRAVEGEESRE